MNWESETQNRLSSLTQRFGLCSLPTACSEIEGFLPLWVREAAIQCIETDAAAKQVRFFSTVGYELFRYGDSLYELRVGCDLATPSRLTIAAVHRPPAVSLASTLTAQLEPIGEVIELYYSFPDELVTTGEAILTTASAILQSGYRWMFEYVRASLDDMHTQAAEELYSFIRRILPRELAEFVMLYVHVNDRGFYVGDTITQEHLFARLRRKAFPVHSPVSEVAHFFSTDLDVERVFSIQAVRENIILRAELLEAPYAESGFQVVEEQVFQSGRVCVHPLVREGTHRLIACYPAQVAGQITEVLDRERETFRALITGQAKALLRTIAKIQKVGGLANVNRKYTELFGSFLRGLLDIG